ncbi:MAG: hypothetical protein WBP10_11445 [Thermoanaerobaculia bacterium]
MSIKEQIYSRSPAGIQNILVSVYGAYWRWVRFGPGFSSEVKGFLAREEFSESQWETWVKARLSSVLEVAANQVPYYRDSWSPAERRGALQGDLLLLPILGKDPIRKAPERFVRDDESGHRPRVLHTSGSTGTPIAVHWKTSEYRAALALREARSVHWAGASYSLPRATFSGRLVVPDPDSEGPYYRYNRAERQVYFSAFHLRADTAAQYVEALHRHRTEWLTGYAVSFYLLAQFMLEQRLEPPPLRAIVTTSEKVTPEMRQAMERAFRCRVHEEYSTVENASFACECEEGSLHVSPEAGIIEIVRPDETHCDPGEVGEVVVTGLLRIHQPLVRFRLGDLAAWSADSCECGRQMPVLQEVLGRIEDVVTAPDGRKMVRFHGVFVDLPGVRRGQIRQEGREKIRVLLECTDSYEAALNDTIVARVQERLGSQVRVVVQVVDAIPLGPGGKFQAVLSRLDKGDTAR